MNIMKGTVASLVIVTLLFSSLPARAGIVGTEQMVAQELRSTHLDTVADFLAAEQVAAQLEAWGVAPELVAERIAALSDAELQRLAATMETDPAGGVLVIIGVVFVVLIILDLVGVTNVFSRI
jgi:hypothetical protein